jgi:hypothetical protein
VPEAVHPDAGTQYAPTGVLFYQRTPAALQAAVRFFEAHETLFCQKALRRYAQRFDRALFKQRIAQLLSDLLQAKAAEIPDNNSAWAVEGRPSDAQEA